MNIEFMLRGAQATEAKADKEAAAGLASASQNYKFAAKQYRDLAQVVPQKRDEYLQKADELEQKAATPQVNLRSNNYTVGPNKPTNNTGAGPVYNNNNRGVNNRPNGQNQPQAQRQEALSSVAATETEDLTVEEALEKLNKLVGLGKVKEQVKQWVNVVKMNEYNKMYDLPAMEDISYHLAFSGNPGTGKTTVARIMAQIYKALGIVKGGQLVETGRQDLVAGFVGQTAMKTQEVVDKAMDGVLFIDEAYTLLGTGGNDFGQEAINTLLTAMENHRDRLIVIIAGYTNEIQKFIESNPGLTSRFTTKIEFEDYTGEEMTQIFMGLVAKNQKQLTPGAKIMLQNYFNALYQHRDKNFGNGRTVRNTFQSVILAQADRLAPILNNASNYDREEVKRYLVTITEDDIIKATKMKQSKAMIDYQRIRNEISDASIYELLSKGDFATIATKLCTRLENTLRYVYGLDGTLDEMIKQLRVLPESSKLRLSKDDFDALYHVRTFRNNIVHSTGTAISITPSDCVTVLKVINAIDSNK